MGKREGILSRLGTRPLLQAYGKMAHDTTMLHEEINVNVQRGGGISSAQLDINHVEERIVFGERGKNRKEKDIKKSITLKNM